MAAKDNDTIRIKLRAYDHKLLEKTVTLILDAIQDTGFGYKSLVHLPVRIHKQTIQRSVHVDKKSREQFELREYFRLLDIVNPTQQTVDALSRLSLAAGVEVEIRL